MLGVNQQQIETVLKLNVLLKLKNKLNNNLLQHVLFATFNYNILILVALNDFGNELSTLNGPGMK